MHQLVYLETLLWVVGIMAGAFGSITTWVIKRLHERVGYVHERIGEVHNRINHMEDTKVSHEVYQEYQRRIEDALRRDHEDHKEVMKKLEELQEKINAKIN